MRCPKCGFISFDHLETCKKCRKEIGEESSGLVGMIYEIEPPLFLNLNVFATKSKQRDEGAGRLEKESSRKDSINFTLEEQSEVDTLEDSFDFSLDDEEETKSVSDSTISEEADFGEIPLELDSENKPASPTELQFESIEEETKHDFEETLDLAETPSEIPSEIPSELPEIEEKQELQLDFGDIDLSDLAPPAQKKKAAAVLFEENEEEAERDEVVMADSLAADSAPPPLPQPGTGLEDLHLPDLEMVSPSINTGAGPAKSVKTGTALDTFEIDLGELITRKKDKKS